MRPLMNDPLAKSTALRAPLRSALAVLFLVCLSARLAAACLPNLQAETPTAAFEINGAVAVHKTTGLMWVRCTLGRVWDEQSRSCRPDAGTARLYVWQDALQAAGRVNVAGFTDWRLPNKNELSSLVERACTGPAINEDVFPDTPLESFWTSTPSLAVTGFAWRIHFTTGTMVPAEATNLLNVRLVREP